MRIHFRCLDKPAVNVKTFPSANVDYLDSEPVRLNIENAQNQYGRTLCETAVSR